MRSEAEIRQVIEWLEHGKSIMDPGTEEGRAIIGAMAGQIDVLKWALGEPTDWDKVHKAMVERHLTKPHLN